MYHNIESHALNLDCPLDGSGLPFTSSRGTQAAYAEMENMREEDGFQEAAGEKGRRKGETKPRQTCGGKQKLMKQDVTIDGSLHPSKHGTLAGPVLTPHPRTPSFALSLFLSPSLAGNYKIHYCLSFSPLL